MITKAYFELSKSKVLAQYSTIKEFADIVSYSYKTNRQVGKLLEQETNCSFSVHTLKSLRELGKDTRARAWFFAQAWSEEELEEITKEGLKCFIIDNEKDLDILLNYIKKRDIRISLLLRMRLKETTIHTGKHFVYGFYSAKVKELLPGLKDNKNIEKIGIHFHRKTQNISEWSLKDELIEALGENNIMLLDIINIGGGLPIRYKNYTVDVSQEIFKKVKELRDFLNSKGIKMIIEPGRFIAGPSVDLIAHIKNIYDNNIIIDCSVYNAAISVFDSNIRFEVETELENAKEGKTYTIKGCTPDSVDIFRYRIFLKEPKIGDIIRFKNVGAYNYSSDFCNLDPLETKIID